MANKAQAPAKINLALHVTGQRDDGYHLLDSLVVFAAVADVLAMTPGGQMSMRVTGRFAEGVPEDSRNLAWRAAEAAGWRGHMDLEKSLPHGAGIGGGSADAAAVLRVLARPDLAPGLGADVPVCLIPVPQRMTGVGDVLAPAPGVPTLHLVLVNAGVHVATPMVFKALQKRKNPGMGDMPGWDSPANFITWLGHQRNDLQAPAITIAPQIGAALEALEGAQLARMSGSGATCFGIYEDAQAAEDAAARIAADHPDWWVVVTVTTGTAP